MSLKKLGGETLIYGLSNILGRMLNFVIVVPFLTRVIGKSGFGVVGDLFFWTGLLIALLVFRMDTAVFRFASRSENNPEHVFRVANRFVLGAVGLVIGGLALGAREVADFLEYPDAVQYIYLVLITVAFDALSAVPLARLRLEQRPWWFVTANLGNVAVNLLFIFILLVWFPKRGVLLGIPFAAERMVLYYLISIAIAAGARYFFLLLREKTARKVVPENELLDTPMPHDQRLLKVMTAYSLPLTVVAVAGIINALVGPTVIRWYYSEDLIVNEAWAGQFNAALKLAVILNLFITAYNYAAEPFFFRQAGNNLANADRTIYADAMRAYTIIAVAASAAILLLLPWLKVLLGEELRQGLFVLPVLLAANICFGIYSNLSVAYKLTDKTMLGGGIALIGSVIVLSISALLVDDIGLYAPALGMLGCYLVMCMLAYQVSRKYFPVNYPIVRMLGYLVIAAAAVYLGEAAGAMGGRIAALVALLFALGLLERKWIQKTFLN